MRLYHIGEEEANILDSRCQRIHIHNHIAGLIITSDFKCYAIATEKVISG